MLFRERTSFDWSFDWKQKNPCDLLTPDLTDDEKVSILGVCTFHPNGYFREKAIKELSKVRTGKEIPYLLIRMNDWVGVVREQAKESILDRLTLELSKEIVKNLPLIMRLQRCMRAEYSEIIEEAVLLLAKEECHKYLEWGLKHTDAKVRLYCYEIILQNQIFDLSTVIHFITKESIPQTRLYVICKIIGTMSGEDLNCFIPVLLKEQFAPIRILALKQYLAIKSEESISVLEKFLFDKNVSIREMARSYLKQKGNYDFAAIYRKALQNEKLLYGAICGLGETGQSEDTEYLIPYLDTKQVKIVKAVLRSLSRLDFQTYKSLLIPFLDDERPGVSKEAYRILYKQIVSSDGQKIYSIYQQSEAEHTKMNTARLLSSLSKWEAIYYIIEICAADNERISKLGQYELYKWKMRYNRSYINPSKEQIEKLKRGVEKYHSVITERDREYLEFVLKDL